MVEDKRIRVMIVDDHDMLRTGLTVFLEAFGDLLLVAEAQGGAEAIQACAEVYPDVVLMDLVMPGMDGVAATREIRRLYPQTQVIALTSFDDHTRVHDALQAGALGYLLKNASIDELANAIRAAHAGRPTLAPEALHALVSSNDPKTTLGRDLTDREREVLGFMVVGLTNGEIADRLVLSRATVKTHVSNILAKLQVENRVEAVALAIQNQLVR